MSTWTINYIGGLPDRQSLTPEKKSQIPRFWYQFNGHILLMMWVKFYDEVLYQVEDMTKNVRELSEPTQKISLHTVKNRAMQKFTTVKSDSTHVHVYTSQLVPVVSL